MRTVLMSVLFVIGVVAGEANAQRDRDFEGRSGRRMPRIADRSGDALRVGQLAPTFVLQSFDGKETYHLAAMRDQRPVILFFGSYT